MISLGHKNAGTSVALMTDTDRVAAKCATPTFKEKNPGEDFLTLGKVAIQSTAGEKG